MTEPEYLLDAQVLYYTLVELAHSPMVQGSAHQMNLVEEYLANMNAAREKSGGGVQYRYIEEEWSDDEQVCVCVYRARTYLFVLRQEMFAQAGLVDDAVSILFVYTCQKK